MACSLSSILQVKRPPIRTTGANFASTYLSRCAPVNTIKLGNGFKVATEKRGGMVATVGLYTKSGSRFESVAHSGAAHLLHKAMWEGTKTKSAEELRAELTACGGAVDLNHGRELSAFRITCLKKDVPKAIALLADVALNARLDSSAVDAARPKCIDTLKDFEDDLYSQTMDGLYISAFDTTDETAGQGLGLTQYGTGQNIKDGISAEDVQQYHKDVYLVPSGMTLVVSGAEDEDSVQTQADKLFGSLEQKDGIEVGKRWVGGDMRRHFNPVPPYHAHVCMGWEACAADCQDNVPLKIMCELHGSYDRFQHDLTQNWNLRFHYSGERITGVDGWWSGVSHIVATGSSMTQYGHPGMIHELHPFLHNYQDTGVMGFYYTYPYNGSPGIGMMERPHVLMKEWLQYCHSMEHTQVDVAKNRAKSKILQQQNGTMLSADVIGEMVSYCDRFVPHEEQLQRVEDCTTQDVSDTINHYYYDRDLCMSSWGSKWDVPWYLTIRGVNKDWFH